MKKKTPRNPDLDPTQDTPKLRIKLLSRKNLEHVVGAGPLGWGVQ
jgi:hypothetical protein